MTDPQPEPQTEPEPQHPPEPQPEPEPLRRLLGRGSWPEAQYVASALRTETVGGALLLGAAVLALVWANRLFTAECGVIGPAHRR